MALTVLLEARPMRAADAVPVVVHLAGLGSRPYTHAGTNDWWAGITDAPRFRTALAFGQSGWTGGAVPTTGAISFAPSDRARIDALAALVWDDAAVTIWTGDDAAADPVWTVALDGVVAGIAARDGVLTITVADLSKKLARPIAADRFTGKGGIDGGSDAAERLKRRSFGRCWGVEARLLDKAANIYEVGDPSRPLGAIDAVKDRGRAASAIVVVAWAGSIAATLDVLKATAAPEGGAAVAPSIACLKWWTQPSGPLTVDLRGEVGASYVETVAEIAVRLIDSVGLVPINAAAAIAARPGAAGLHIDSDSETAGQALDRLLLRSSLLWLLEPAGAVRLLPIAFDAAGPVIDAIDASREASYKPVTRIVLGYRRNHRIHNSGEISAAVAASDVVYADGTLVEVLKPAQPGADVTSENKSADTAAVGGRPAQAVLATLDAIDPIIETYPALAEQVSAIEEAQVGTDAALEALDRATGDQAAAIAQAERDAGRIGETLLRLLAESDRTRAVLRDAGIVVDPSSGIVRIYAVDQLAERTARAEIGLDAATASITQKASVEYVQEQIALAVLDPVQAAQLGPIIARLTSAEQTISGLGALVSTKAEALELTRVSARVTTVQSDLDALAGTVSLKASRTDVDAQGQRIGLVEAALSSLPDVSSFGVTVRQARAVADDAAEAGLRALLAGDEAHRRQITQQAEARTEMFAKMADQSGAEAAARQLLSVQIGAVDARSVQESVARVAGDTALSIRIDAQAAASADLAAAITTLREASIAAGKGIAGITTTIRQQAADDDTTAEALLRALIAGDVTGRARATQLAQVQSELTTTLVANEQASAVARQALLVRMASAEAAIVTTSRALADLSQSLVERIAAAEAVVRDPVTGLAATRAQLAEVDRLRSEGDTANAQSTASLSAQVNHPTTGLPATRAEQITDRQASAERDAANVRLIDALSGQVNDPTTGLPATRVQLVSDREASLGRDEALGRRVDTVSASIGDTNAAVALLGEAMVDGDGANAASIQQVRARLDGVGGVGVEQSIEAVVDRLGIVEGRYTVSIDADGNLVGFQLIGGASGPGSLNLINTDLRMGTGRIVFDNGVVMRVQGTGFGAARDLLSWYGPSMPIAACTRANAISYETTTGDAYFGGGLTAGTLRNGNASSSLAVDATAEVPPFGSNGKPVQYIASWSYSRQSQTTYSADRAGQQAYAADVQLYGAVEEDGVAYGTRTEQRSASTIRLYRTFDGASAVDLDGRSFSTLQSTFTGYPPTPGDAAGTGIFTSTIGGGFTVTDPVQSVANRSLRLALQRGFTITNGTTSQRLTIVAIEE